MHDKNGAPLSRDDDVRVLCDICGGTLADSPVLDEMGPLALVRVSVRHVADHLSAHNSPSMERIAHLDHLAKAQGSPGSAVVGYLGSRLEKR